MIHTGDCLEVMAGMEAESIDAICTDPPYGLEFMGKEWDKLGAITLTDPSVVGGFQDGNGGNPFSRSRVRYGRDVRSAQAWHQEWAEAAYRVAKPSAYLLAFGGTRTVHRMTCALEDAGWIIRDMLVWAYASGFPKSKASLKPAWEPIVMSRKPGPLRELAIDACRIPGAKPAMRDLPNERVDMAAFESRGRTSDGTTNEGRWPANVVLTDAIFDGGIEGVVGGGETTSGKMLPTEVRSGDRTVFGSDAAAGYTTIETYGDSGTYSRFFLVPKADRADREPILDDYAYELHRERGECKPTRRGRATGEATTPADNGWSTTLSGSGSADPSPPASRSTTSTGIRPTTGSTTSSPLTASPTSASIPAASSETVSGGSPAGSAESSSLWEPPTGISVPRAGRSMDDADPAISGWLSRRSVCARCGGRLPRFSTHPTQKPTDLMRHLVRLVTPAGGTVLDPFLGSGTTGIACELEGFPWIGIEREAEYVAIAEARLNGVQKGLGLVG